MDRAADHRDLLIATSNPHKVDEFRAIFAGLPYRLVIPAEIGLEIEVEETGTTFAENARLKAVAYADASGLLSLADDSGLEIDALGGEPGVYSSRWAGPDVTYPERFAILFERLRGVPPEQRTARYRCVIALAEPSPVGLIGEANGTLEGTIAEEARGSGGFGYDPIFYVPDLGRTVGEISAEEKHRISHRARAAAGARAILDGLALANGANQGPGAAGNTVP